MLSVASAFHVPVVPQLQSVNTHVCPGRSLPRCMGARMGDGDHRGKQSLPIGEGDAVMQTHRQAPALERLSSASSSVVGAAAASLCKRIQACAMALVLVLTSNFFLAPPVAHAVTASGKSQLRQSAHSKRSEQSSRKKLVLVGAGISATLHQVFDSLDHHRTGAISKDVC